MHADEVARCTVFPPTHWCGWLPGKRELSRGPSPIAATPVRTRLTTNLDTMKMGHNKIKGEAGEM
jgi:hypothetical protein